MKIKFDDWWTVNITAWDGFGNPDTEAFLNYLIIALIECAEYNRRGGYKESEKRAQNAYENLKKKLKKTGYYKKFGFDD